MTLVFFVLLAVFCLLVSSHSEFTDNPDPKIEQRREERDARRAGDDPIEKAKTRIEEAPFIDGYLLITETLLNLNKQRLKALKLAEDVDDEQKSHKGTSEFGRDLKEEQFKDAHRRASKLDQLRQRLGLNDERVFPLATDLLTEAANAGVEPEAALTVLLAAKQELARRLEKAKKKLAKVEKRLDDDNYKVSKDKDGEVLRHSENEKILLKNLIEGCLEPAVSGIEAEIAKAETAVADRASQLEAARDAFKSIVDDHLSTAAPLVDSACDQYTQQWCEDNCDLRKYANGVGECRWCFTLCRADGFECVDEYKCLKAAKYFLDPDATNFPATCETASVACGGFEDQGFDAFTTDACTLLRDFCCDNIVSGITTTTTTTT